MKLGVATLYPIFNVDFFFPEKNIDIFKILLQLLSPLVKSVFFLVFQWPTQNQAWSHGVKKNYMKEIKRLFFNGLIETENFDLSFFQNSRFSFQRLMIAYTVSFTFNFLVIFMYFHGFFSFREKNLVWNSAINMLVLTQDLLLCVGLSLYLTRMAL